MCFPETGDQAKFDTRSLKFVTFKMKNKKNSTKTRRLEKIQENECHKKDMKAQKKEKKNFQTKNR